MIGLAWALVAGALVLAPVGRARRSVAGRALGKPGARAARHRPAEVVARTGFLEAPAAAVAAALALGGACVALLGMQQGLKAAAAVVPLAFFLLRALRGRPARAPDDPALPVTLDLVAAALRIGRPLPDALVAGRAAAGATTSRQLEQVAALLRLGASAAQAWADVPADGPLAAVAGPAVRSATSGIRLAAAFERLADELRADRAAAAAVRAHHAGVLAMAPLAACFLPAFVCLGVVPVVVGVARNALGAIP